MLLVDMVKLTVGVGQAGALVSVKTYSRDGQNTTVVPLITRRQMLQYSHKNVQ